MSDTAKLDAPALAKGDFRLAIAIAVIIGLALLFWLGSRYPALNEKAMMGGDTPLSGLAFDIVIDVFPDSSRWWQFVANTFNWIATNVKGMTFGVLFGACALTLLSLLKTRSFENGFANAALGALIGAPLGVCVNCAAPIALGLHAGRMRLETTLSALFASPTLNVVVVTMSFSLLPLHVALTKLVLALVMVLLVVPLMCRFVLVAETKSTRSGIASLAAVSKSKGISAWIGKSLEAESFEAKPGNIIHSVLWFVRKFARNLALIAIITVPMMLIAAMMGAAVAMNFDSAALANLLPHAGVIPILVAMVCVALVASFVPAPIAMDVILTIVLMGVGLSSDYATVILISLGSFSVYAFFVLWKAVSLRSAMAMWAATIALAVCGGVIANKAVHWEVSYQVERMDAFLASRAGFDLEALPELPPAEDLKQIKPALEASAVEHSELAVEYTSTQGSTISVLFSSSTAEGQAPKGDDSPSFERIPGPDLGLEDIGIATPLQELAPTMMVGGIAAGDIHNDGWTDVVYPRPRGSTGLSLYANVGGTFRRQNIDLGPVGDYQIANTAFADLNNDGLLDLVVTTFWDGVYIFENEDGGFDQARLKRIASGQMSVAMALSFADMDSDGRLDILLGNWASRQGSEGWSRKMPTSTANQILWNRPAGFDLQRIAGSVGQTLTALVTDVDRDGRPDYLKGDDIKATDQFVFFDKDKQSRADRELQPFPYFVQTSMSYDEGDWNNDLVPDYYGGQISNPHGSSERDSLRGDGIIVEICQQIGRDLGWNQERERECASRLVSIDSIRKFRTGLTFDLCQSAVMTELDSSMCGILHSMGSIKNDDFFKGEISGEQAAARCNRQLARWPFAKRYCDTFATPVQPELSREEKRKVFKPALLNGNILMTGDARGVYENDAAEQEVDFPGWTWNSRFTDLDQDGWQDLLVMTGSWFNPTQSSTNVFYRNDAGKFSDQTARFGLRDVTPSYSFAVFDFDRDGDIDVVRPPDGRLPIVHRNNRPKGGALWVQLRDLIGNRMGVGARVTICFDGVREVAKGRCQTRPINASGGFMSFDPIAAHFGLGDATTVSHIEVVWRDGETSRLFLKSLSAGEVTIVRQP